MRRSIDDHTDDHIHDHIHDHNDDQPATTADVPSGLEDDLVPVSWAVAISDDYDDASPRVVLTVEEVGRPATGLVAHLSPAVARRLRAALADALQEIGESPDRPP